MQNEELNQMKYFIADIQDKLDALRLEVNRGTPYARYCLEKLEPIIINANCLKSIFEKKLIKNDISTDQSN